MPFQPIALYGLEVPPGVLVPAAPDFPASFRITMAAIDPTEDPEPDEDGNVPAIPRATLRLVKQRFGTDLDDDDDDEIDEEYMKALMAASPDDDDSESDDEVNGGPSDPSKKKKNGAAELLEALKNAQDEESDEDMDDAKPNGVKSKKGKEKASDDDDEDEEDSDDDDDDGEDLEQFVVCTLDTERNYQQTIDIVVAEGEKVFFGVSGTHTVHLTGNYVIDDDESEEDSDEYDEEDMYDLASDELLGGDLSDEEDDDLDSLDDPRVMEVDSEEEAPKLVSVAKKGKGKRAAEEDAEGLDELISKDDSKQAKKQAKKVKNNKGEAVAAAEEAKAKSDKKVQFAKNLEQGPTGSAEKGKSGKATLGVKVVQGVTLDDRKIGEGRAVKNGDTVGVRYIGKLDSGKVFDSNKKGKPFSFKVGKNQVIKGWDIGILGMTIGGERRLSIPAHLAYGSKGMPGIPANSTLQFDVKLLEIK